MIELKHPIDPLQVLARARAELARRRDLEVRLPVALDAPWATGGRPVTGERLERLSVQLRALEGQGRSMAL